ncbi:hypothetical protein BTZ20_1100 [Rhodococcus sp. MTM3W5.2]|nr:hypothetical protein BTZ20_1100 [Rhodococcus sp. MTM3W5.2]
MAALLDIVSTSPSMRFAPVRDRYPGRGENRARAPKVRTGEAG